MENKTIEVGTQVKTTRVVYAGSSPHAVTYKNLAKLDVGATGTVYESYHRHETNTTVYVVKFYVGDSNVFAYMSATSFVLASQ